MKNTVNSAYTSLLSLSGTLASSRASKRDTLRGSGRAFRLYCMVLLLLFVQIGFMTSPASALEKNKPYKNLLPSRPVEGVLDLSDSGRRYETYRFFVPEDLFALELALENAPADLDLFVLHGEDIQSYDKVDYAADGEAFNETLYISRDSDTPLTSGYYYLDVVYQRSRLPKVDGKLLEAVPFTLSLRYRNSEVRPLIPGELTEGVLRPEEGMTSRFYIDVPAYTRGFRIDVVETKGDVDFYLTRENPVSGKAGADYVAESYLGREYLVIDSTSQPPLEAGRYYLTLFDQVSSQRSEAFTVVASLSTDPPEQLKLIPQLAVPSDEFETVLFASLEIIGESGRGSGTLVSRDGLILTNWHVIEGADGSVSSPIYIAANIDSRYPPEELFRAEVEELDREADLALLRVTASLTGTPLPAGYRFPFLPLGESRTLRIGQPLSFIGYPAVGGSGSRASVSVSRGIVSGYEVQGGLTLVKTDGLINSGSSGGAVVDAYHQLVGIPTAIVGKGGGQIGYFTPLSMVPESWLRKIELHNLR